MTDEDSSTTTVGGGKAAEREQLAVWLGRMVAELAGQRCDYLAELRAQAAELAKGFREAGEDRIAEELLLVTGPRGLMDRRQEWIDLDGAPSPSDGGADAGGIFEVTDADSGGTTGGTGEAAEREQLALWLGQMVAELAGLRDDHLAELRSQAAELAKGFREAGEDRIAEKLLLLTRARASKGRPQEWLELDYALLANAVFLLMWRERLSARGACRRLADMTTNRSWLLVFDNVVAARHRPTEHALYEQFRIWLRKHGSSIKELNDLAKANGGVVPDAGLPPHLLLALLNALAWFKWVDERIPKIEGPRSRKLRERQAAQSRAQRSRTAPPRS